MPGVAKGQLLIDLARHTFQQRLQTRVPGMQSHRGHDQVRTLRGILTPLAEYLPDIFDASFHRRSIICDLLAQARQRRAR